MFPKTRLGKRSPLGALLSSGCPFTVRPDQNSDQILGQLLGYALSPSEPFSGSDTSCSRSVSSSIDVPKRRAQEADMDELMAAMVLSSLSCSPRLHSNAHESSAAGADCAGELSDCSSGYWSVGHSRGSPAASSPVREQDGGLAPPPDEGLSMELGEQVLFEEPAARKRRNSEHAALKCLWPGCEKVLTSIVGIKRHVRTMHLHSCGVEHERCSRSEEDFYYTEVSQWEESQRQPPCVHPVHPHTPPPPPPAALCPRPHLASVTPPPPPPSIGWCRPTTRTRLRSPWSLALRPTPSGQRPAADTANRAWLPECAQSVSVSSGCSRAPPAGGSAAKPRNAVKFMALNTESSGARRVAGKRPVSALWTNVVLQTDCTPAPSSGREEDFCQWFFRP
uniref:C2H2-type domain-containing protein n=1 Tax=Neogobius melanostomus TaxID=47308 RepID=A0A8C6WM86_9GOBI